MMVNLDNSGSSAQASSVGFGLEDLIHLNNNNHEGDKVSRDKTDIEKVRKLWLGAVVDTELIFTKV